MISRELINFIMIKSPRTLFIGMPTYNEERYIQSAIESLQRQSYTDWVLFISDNTSTDSTSTICNNLSLNDNRIIHNIQEENIGLIENFNFVYDEFINNYECNYFMWAQSDDLWEPSFLESCITQLESNKNTGASFTGMDNIDSYGRLIRQYPSYKRFTLDSKFRNMVQYLMEPELLGKCNMFLGVYRRNVIRDIMTNVRFTKLYSDYVIAFGILSISKLAVDNRVLYHKRDDRIEDNKSYPKPIVIMSMRDGIAPLRKLISLHLLYTKHLNGIVPKIAVLILVLYRIPRSIYATASRYMNYFRLSNISKIKGFIFKYYKGFSLKKYEFRKQNREIIDIGYGYAYTSSYLTLKLDQLQFKLKGSTNELKYHITDTPHFSFVEGIISNNDSKKDSYIRYKEEQFPEIDISEQVNSFESLISNMKNDFRNKALSVSVLIENNRLLSSSNYKAIVVDGTHRLAILANLGVDRVVCKIVDEIDYYND